MPPTEPALAAPEVTPAAGSAAAAQPEAKAEGFDTLLSNLLEDVPEGQLTPEQKDLKEKEDKRKKEAADPKAAETARVAAEAEDKKKKEAANKPPEKPITARREKLKRPELPVERPADRKEAPPVVAPAASAASDADLIDDEKQYIADAEEAEKLLGEAKKGFAAKAKAFVRANIEFIKSHGGDENFDDTTPEYQRFLAEHKPVITAAEQRTVNERRIADQVAERTRPEIERMKDQRFADREEPRIERAGEDTYRKLALQVAPKEIMDAITEAAPQFGGDRNKAFEAVKGHFRLELEVVDEVLNEVRADVREMERISTINPETGRSLSESALNDPRSPKHAHHQKLKNIVQAVCNEFKNQAPAAQQVRGDKWFVTKDEWFEIIPSERHKFWTFGNREIMERALKAVPGYVAAQIKKRQAEYEAKGFVRKPRESKSAPIPPPVKGAPAAPHPTAVPTGSGGDVKSEGAKLAATLAAG